MATTRLLATVTATAAAIALANVAAVTPGFANAAPGFGGGRGIAMLAKSRLTLTIAPGEAPRPVLRRATLTCSPPGGTHKQASSACAALTKARGDFAALRVSNGACTMQYQPVTVTAAGNWRDKKVSYQRTFGNACVLAVETGPVFRF